MIDHNFNDISSNNIENFYNEKCIFITGFTGFIGKVLVEKLLRSLNVRKIIVIIREKKGLSADERLKDTIKSKAFHFHKETETNLHKLVPVIGDISLPYLGLNKSDLKMIIDEVSIVFHVAASVRFNSNFKNSLRDNLIGTKNLIETCHLISNLESLIHVSTAYSFCHLSEIEERVYPLKLKADDALYMYNCLDEDALEALMPFFNEGRPNSYVLSKALAENLVMERKKNMTVSIVRPSIVSQAMKEPAPGWIDNLNGISGIAMAASLGVVQTYNWNYYATVDLIPVDYVANGIISIGWYAANNEQNNCKVYHLTTGSMNPITWGSFFEYAYELTIEKPSIKMIRPFPRPPKYSKVPIYYPLQVFFHHFLFAYIFDYINSWFGSDETRKISLVRATRKLHFAMDLFDHYTRRSWKFHNVNCINVLQQLPLDSSPFDFDVRRINWRNYCQSFVDGNRRYLLKEDDSNIEKAKKRLIKLKAFHKLIPLLWIVLGWFILALTRHLINILENSVGHLFRRICF